MWFPPSIGHGWGGLPALEAIVVCYFDNPHVYPSQYEARAFNPKSRNRFALPPPRIGGCSTRATVPPAPYGRRYCVTWRSRTANLSTLILRSSQVDRLPTSF